MPLGTDMLRSAAYCESISESTKRTVANELAGTTSDVPFIPVESTRYGMRASIGALIEPIPLFASFTAASKQGVIVAFVFNASIFTVYVPAVSVASAVCEMEPESEFMLNGYSDQS